MQWKETSMSNVVLECNHVKKKIGHHTLIDDLTLQLYEGDILGFIGPNGAGKTTSIKLMLGLQFFDEGSVKIGGYHLRKEFTLAISQVGAIIENPDLYMYMSGYENLNLVAKLYQIPRMRILEVAKLVGLEERIYDKVKKYSLGMRQRLGIAQAILHHPKLLILDEPMNGLDPEGIKSLKVLLQRLAQEEKMAILISSHILSELESFCNRICILVKGKIIKDLNMEELQKITSHQSYILEVSQVELDNILYHYEVLDDTHIRIVSPKDNIGNILKTLLLNEIAIYEVKKETQSLEELFLKATKENSIA